MTNEYLIDQMIVVSVNECGPVFNDWLAAASYELGIDVKKIIIGSLDLGGIVSILTQFLLENKVSNQSIIFIQADADCRYLTSFDKANQMDYHELLKYSSGNEPACYSLEIVNGLELACASLKIKPAISAFCDSISGHLEMMLLVGGVHKVLDSNLIQQNLVDDESAKEAELIMLVKQKQCDDIDEIHQLYCNIKCSKEKSIALIMEDLECDQKDAESLYECLKSLSANTSNSSQEQYLTMRATVQEWIIETKNLVNKVQKILESNT